MTSFILSSSLSLATNSFPFTQTYPLPHLNVLIYAPCTPHRSAPDFFHYTISNFLATVVGPVSSGQSRSLHASSGQGTGSRQPIQ